MLFSWAKIRKDLIIFCQSSILVRRLCFWKFLCRKLQFHFIRAEHQRMRKAISKWISQENKRALLFKIMIREEQGTARLLQLSCVFDWEKITTALLFSGLIEEVARAIALLTGLLVHKVFFWTKFFSAMLWAQRCVPINFNYSAPYVYSNQPRSTLQHFFW